MKHLLVFTVILGFSLLLNAQQPGLPDKTLKKVRTLKMPRNEEDDVMPGTRGGAVAWHPVQKKYYAVFCGNGGYPLSIFNETGNRLSDDSLSAMNDTRGIWFNPGTKLISGNGYSEIGWFTYKLDSKGIVTDSKIILEGMHQPDPQCVGAYNTAGKQVVFLKGSGVFFYNDKGDPTDSILIHWGRKKADGPADDEEFEISNEDYNYTTVIFTGIKGQELGFLNTVNKEIELYDIKTGYLSQVLALPESATVEQAFNFSFSNGTYWLFDMEKREWVGYK